MPLTVALLVVDVVIVDVGLVMAMLELETVTMAGMTMILCQKHGLRCKCVLSA